MYHDLPMCFLDLPWFGNEDWDPLDEDGKIYVNPEWWFSVDGPSELPFVGINSQIYEFWYICNL